MKTKIAVVLFFLTCINCQAQENKLELGLSVFPNFSLGIISNDGSVPSEVESNYRDIQIAKPSISSNIFVEYSINEKSIIGLGMGYQNNGSRTKKEDAMVWGINPITGEGFLEPNLVQVRNIYSHHNIEIPMYYKHIFGEKLFVLIGVSSILNVSNSSTSIQYHANGSKKRNTWEDNSTEFRKYNFSGNIGFGYDYLNIEKLSLFVFPYLQYGFLGVSKTAPLNRNFLSVGISTGIRF